MSETSHPAPPDRPEKKNPIVHLLVWIAVAGVFVLGFYLVSGNKRAEAPGQGGHGHMGMGTPTVLSVTAKKGEIGVYLQAIGTVTPVYTASIVNQVTGNVVDVHFKEGQLVNKGDPLVEIDSRQYEATLLQAQGTLEKDQSGLAKDQIDLERYQAAFARNAVSKQILDDQIKLVSQDKAQVKTDEGAVKYDQVQVDYCHITAPFTGRVGLRLVDPGNLVTAGSSATPLVVVTQLQPITVIFTFSEDNLSAVQDQLAKGEKLAVDVFDRTAQTKIAQGELMALDNQIDTTTGTLKARALFPNDDLRLFPNQFVNTRLLVQTMHDATLIPSAAIQQNGTTSFVYVIQDGVVHQRTVKPGVTDNGLTQVEGISPGDLIADSSFDKLQDGDKVNVSDKKPAATASPGASPAGGDTTTTATDTPGAVSPSPSPHEHKGGHRPGSPGSSGS